MTENIDRYATPPLVSTLFGFQAVAAVVTIIVIILMGHLAVWTYRRARGHR
jgi:hypothetical protein